MTTKPWPGRMRDVASGQRAMIAGAVVLALAALAAPLATSAAGGPYDGARIDCAASSRLGVDVKGNGFPGNAPVKVALRTLGKVVASTSSTTSASGSFSAFLVAPSPIALAEITATVNAGATVVRASCTIAVRL